MCIYCKFLHISWNSFLLDLFWFHSSKPYNNRLVPV